jgi:Pirin C-terminal cupin domain
MTAGAGVVHSEMPEAEFARTGGRLHGIQLWINLPQRDKMIAPRYQEIPSAQIPVAQTQDGSVAVRVIAGEALGAKAVIETRTPIIYLHFTLQPGASMVQPVPKEYNAFAYVLDGSGLFGTEQERGEDGQMVIFAPNGEEVAIANPADAAQPLDLLLIAGVPLNEPVVRYGPFVMNTEAEILPAIDRFMFNTLQHRITQHQLLTDIRIKLLRLHKLLLDTERIRYEQVRGQVSKGELLQLVINHDQFTWLHRLSELIVQIDELIYSDEPVISETIAALIADVRTLLTPDEAGNDFSARYDAAFQRNPDVVLAHADLVTLLATKV